MTTDFTAERETGAVADFSAPAPVRASWP